MIVDRTKLTTALPGYELGGTLGKGGFGLVLAARHRELDRPVAIKIVPAGSTSEGRLLASMDHPHIVRIYDYVEADGLCLVVMELLSGGTLSRRAAGMAPEAACAVGLAVAAALSCAHARGVLHRDVKTDNVLFDAAGLLKVTDFGIAKIVEGSEATASAAGVGTPAYMAPEQITGGRLGPATDLYALGVVLYKLLTGVHPFDLTLPVQALWQQHLATTPAPPAGVPAPVAQVVLAALAKDPAARPLSARAFALDLGRAAADTYGSHWTARSGIVLRLDDDIREAAGDHQRTPTPVLAGPVPPDPADVLRACALPMSDLRTESAPLAAAVGPPPVAGEASAAVPPRHLADGRLPVEPDVRLGGNARPDRRAGRRRRVGWLQRRRARVAAAFILLVVATGTVLTIKSPWSGNGNPNATSTAGPTALNPRSLGPPLTGHTTRVLSVALSPDGRTLASGDQDNTVRLWDLTNLSAPRPLSEPLTGEAGEVQSLAFSRNGRTLAIASKADNTVRLWYLTDRTAPRPLPALEGHTDQVLAVAFSPDGRTLASGSDDNTVRLWDVSDPAHPQALGAPLTGNTDYVCSLAFSPDGTTLAAGDGSPAYTVRLWDVSDQANAHPLGQPLKGHTDEVCSVSFSHDGHTLASAGSYDRTVRLWDLADRSAPQALSEPLVHTTRVRAAVFSPADNTVLATGCGDNAVRLWDVADPSAPRLIAEPLTNHTDEVYAVAFSSDGRTLASAGGWDQTVRLWAMH